MKKIETEKAPKAIGPYSQAVQAGNYLFVSGQLPIDPKTNKLVADQIEVQAEQVLDNIVKSFHPVEAQSARPNF